MFGFFMGKLSWFSMYWFVFVRELVGFLYMDKVVSLEEGVYGIRYF